MNRYRFYEILQANKNGEDLSQFVPTNAAEAELIANLGGGSNGGVSPFRKFFDGKADGYCSMTFVDYQLEDIDGMIQYDDTINVTALDDFFYNSINLKRVTLFNTENVTSMSGTFQDCSSLEELPNYNMKNVENTWNMCYGCTSLRVIPEYFDTPKLTKADTMFGDCSLLTKIKMNTDSVTTMVNIVSGCSSLEIFDITKYNLTSTNSSSNMLKNCAALKAFVVRNVGSLSISTSAFAGSGIANGTGYIYVPRDEVNTVKAATTWSTYATQIRPLEDYTVDGTTTGALDESKI